MDDETETETEAVADADAEKYPSWAVVDRHVEWARRGLYTLYTR